jgi:hypothetical protein
MMITGLQLGRLLRILPELAKTWQLVTAIAAKQGILAIRAIAFKTGNRFIDVWFYSVLSNQQISDRPVLSKVLSNLTALVSDSK